MIETYPNGLTEDRQELWRLCDSMLHSADSSDRTKEFTLFIRSNLRIEARFNEVLDALKDITYAHSNNHDEETEAWWESMHDSLGPAGDGMSSDEIKCQMRSRARAIINKFNEKEAGPQCPKP